MRQLGPDDVLGQKIAAVLQTPWQEGPGNSITTCWAGVLLTNGVLFTFEPWEATELEEAQIDRTTLLPAEYRLGDPPCNGESVRQLVVCDYWPTHGVLLSSNRILHFGVLGDWVALMFTPVVAGNRYDEYLTFWDRKPLVV